MKGKDVKYIIESIENEGFNYAFIHYSDFKEVDDEEFHKLRENYENAYHELADYVGYD